MKYGLIGKRLGYSYSQTIHEFLMKRAPAFQEGSYHLLEMPDLSFPQGYGGFNITNPYKNRSLVEECLCSSGYERKDAFSESGASGERDTAIEATSLFCGLLTDGEKARACYREIVSHAVNTVSISGRYAVMHNTDIFGFCYSFSAMIKEAEEVCVLGTGSTSRMVRILMHYLGIPTQVVGRESVSALRTLSAGKSAVRLLVNCTPIGTAGYPDRLSGIGIDRASLQKFGFVADLTYNPEETELISLARESGLVAKSGLEMLVAQALTAQMIWNGVSIGDYGIEKDRMTDETLDMLRYNIRGKNKNETRNRTENGNKN
ncbi:MAG: hypothetical protein Q4A41_01670 [Bacillota bacterium]|nr:hypothetical protein [Bacillota bacterium]